MSIISATISPVLERTITSTLSTGGADRLAPAISLWNASEADTRSFYGGRESAFSADSSVNGGAGTGRTFVGGYVAEGIRQDGLVRSIEYQCNTVGSADQWKFILFRPDGSGNYDKVDETDLFTPPGTGAQTYVPSSPLGPCQPGDRVGLFLGVSGTPRINVSADGNSLIHFSEGDLETISSPTLVDNFSLNIRFKGIPPFLCTVGDSIMEGNNGSSRWWTHQNNLGPTGNPLAEIPNQIRARESSLEYQNFARGGQTWAFGASIVSSIAALGPRCVIAHFGVNDINTGRTWAAVEADMDTFLAGLPAGTALFVNEILPWSNGNDTQAGTVRTFNENYAAWCAANGARLISIHDPMGQVRVSTGELDDLATAYDKDGVHLTEAGVDAAAAIEFASLNAYPWPA